MQSLSLLDEEVNDNKISLLNSWLVNGQVVDLGTGSGLYGLHCGELGHAVKLYDIVDRRLPAAEGLPFQTLDLQTELDTTEADNVLLFDVIEHLDDDEGFMRRVFSALKPGSRVFLSVPNEDNLSLSALSLAHIHFTDKTHQREYSQRGLESLVMRSGGRVICSYGQINRRLERFPFLFSTPSSVSSGAATIFTWLMKGLLRIGVFKNQVVSDWLLVAEKT